MRIKFSAFKCFVLSSLFLGGVSQAVNISFNSFGDNPDFKATSGDPLDIGSAIRIGFFVDSADPILMGRNYAAINELFIPLGEGDGSNGRGTGGPLRVVTPTGEFGGAIENVTNSGVAAGTPVFVLVLNQASTSVMAGTEFGLFSDSSWRIPDETAVDSDLTINTSQINVASESFSGGRVSDTDLNLVTAVPEPSSAVLISLVGLGLVVRRRR